MYIERDSIVSKPKNIRTVKKKEREKNNKYTEELQRIFRCLACNVKLNCMACRMS